MKKYLPFVLILLCAFAKAQPKKIDSIYVNLYTDSLKKGTYNYINVDGLLSNGHYYPLDSNYVQFSASAGRFLGNSLWLDNDFKEDKVKIKIVLRSNPALHKEFDMYIKKKPDGKLKTVDEIIGNTKHRAKNQ